MYTLVWISVPITSHRPPISDAAAAGMSVVATVVISAIAAADMSDVHVPMVPYGSQWAPYGPLKKDYGALQKHPNIEL